MAAMGSPSRLAKVDASRMSKREEVRTERRRVDNAGGTWCPLHRKCFARPRDEHDHDIDTLLQESLGGEL